MRYTYKFSVNFANRDTGDKMNKLFLALDAFCSQNIKDVEKEDVLFIDIPFSVNQQVYNFSQYSTADFVQNLINEEEVYIDEEDIDQDAVIQKMQDVLNNGDEILYVCTVDKFSVNYYKIQKIITLLQAEFKNQFHVISLPSSTIAVKPFIEDVIKLFDSKIPAFHIRHRLMRNLKDYKAITIVEDCKIIDKLKEKRSMSFSYGIKPIYLSTLENNELEMLTKDEGLTPCVNKVADMIKYVKTNNKNLKLYISYLKSANHAELLETLIRKGANDKVTIQKQSLTLKQLSRFGVGAIMVSFVGEI